MAREGLAAQRVYVRVPDNKRPCLIDQYRIYTSGAVMAMAMAMVMGAVMGALVLVALCVFVVVLFGV